MNLILSVFSAIFVFGLIVLVHELGHFVTAKLTGMRVDEFAIGFGKAIASIKKGETVYSFRMIPLGGFNSIAGMTEEVALEEKVPANRSFYSKSAPIRLIVLGSGAMMNFLLALVIFIGGFSVNGVSEINHESIVGQVLPQAIVTKGDLRPGDRIVRIGDYAIDEWKDISPAVQKTNGEFISLTLERDNKEFDVEMLSSNQNGRRVIGVAPAIIQRPVDFFEAVNLGVERCYTSLVNMISGLGSLVVGQGSSTELAGPLGIAQMAGSVAETGFWNLLMFAAILSLNLGLINLLPIPLLDGGRIFLVVVEMIIRRKLPDKMEYYIQVVGLIFLSSVFVWVTGNDILRMLK